MQDAGLGEKELGLAVGGSCEHSAGNALPVSDNCSVEFPPAGEGEENQGHLPLFRASTFQIRPELEVKRKALNLDERFNYCMEFISFKSLKKR